VTLTTSFEAVEPRTTTVAKPALARRLLPFAAVGLALVVLVAAGIVAIKARMVPPEAVVEMEWPTDEQPTPKASGVEPAPNGRGLPLAPDQRLIDPLPIGLIPRIGDDGARPSTVYARPVTPISGPLAQAPRIAFLIAGAGIGHLVTVEAMLKLPPNTSFALSPYSADIERQAADLRSEGHELFLEMPVSEPGDLLGSAGPKALGNSLHTDVNRERLHWAMARFSGYLGISGNFSALLSERGSATSALTEISGRGLVLLDLDTEGGPIWVDQDLRSHAIDEALRRLEETARTKGRAIGVAGTTPLAINRIQNWIAGLAERGIRMVPVSALLRTDGVK